MKSKPYILKYSVPAPFGNEGAERFSTENPENDGWEKWSLPVGNGFFGASIFGRIETERIQLTENSFANPMNTENCGAGLNNLAEIYIDFFHNNPEKYGRGLDIEKAEAYVEYDFAGVKYRREYFASYPDRVMIVKLTAGAENALSFRLRAEVPFVRDYCVKPNDGMGKTGGVSVCDNFILLTTHLEMYDVYGAVCVLAESNGRITADSGALSISDADSAVIYISCATNYRLCAEIFTESDPKKKLRNKSYPTERVISTVKKAAEKGAVKIKEDHLKDYKGLFGTASLDLGGEVPECTTDRLLEDFRNGGDGRYLQELLFQYGRYLLIASSRKGGLPANLQGIWNCYADAPWTAGYWHNINIQMNYWFCFGCGLARLFKPYADYFSAYRKAAENGADSYVRELFPENYEGAGNNGWSIATGGWPYEIQPINADEYNHSGPGTGAMTAMLFWDYYDFTADKELLARICYPALYGASLFLSKIMVCENGAWLIKYSASPEQWQDGKCYRTKGCAFDQQTCREVFCATVKAAEILGLDNDSLIKTLRERKDRLEPFLYGESGQVKEFREEKEYGSIGEYHHRHISQLVGFYPGVFYDKEDSRLREAVKKTLDLRGDRSTGWATAHRICAWARTGDRKRTSELAKTFINNCILPNLWDTHPPFQIDGNFGYCAGVYEMLIQSHGDSTELLPAIPEEWSEGAFCGLYARGGFSFSVSWKKCRPYKISVYSKAGKMLRLKTGNLKIAGINTADGGRKPQYSIKNGILSLETVAGEEYIFILKGEDNGV